MILNGTCSATCPDGNYISGNQCLPCSASCQTCRISNWCDVCASGFSYNGTCVPTCPSNTFAINQVCIPCDASCATCSVHPYNCLTCPANWYKLGSVCLKNCPLGYYTNEQAFTCVSCGPKCKSCNQNGQCL